MSDDISRKDEDLEDLLEALPETLTPWAERVYQAGGRDALLGDGTVTILSLRDGKATIVVDAWSGFAERLCDLETEVIERIEWVEEGIKGRVWEDVIEGRRLAEQLIALGGRLMTAVDAAPPLELCNYPLSCPACTGTLRVDYSAAGGVMTQDSNPPLVPWRCASCGEAVSLPHDPFREEGIWSLRVLQKTLVYTGKRHTEEVSQP